MMLQFASELCIIFQLLSLEKGCLKNLLKVKLQLCLFGNLKKTRESLKKLKKPPKWRSPSSAFKTSKKTITSSVEKTGKTSSVFATISQTMKLQKSKAGLM